MISDTKIYNLVKEFRNLVDLAKENGLFSGDLFEQFPYECCGDMCSILGEFLLNNNIQGIVVSGDSRKYGSHAWLVLKDDRVNYQQQFLDAPDEVRQIFNFYRACERNTPIDITHYEEIDIQAGLIIDITADQFGEDAVYVGFLNEFYKSFEFIQAKDYSGLEDDRLINLYKIILSAW